jgi:hypothetical protein
MWRERAVAEVKATTGVPSVGRGNSLLPLSNSNGVRFPKSRF